MTTTEASLTRVREIIDCYVEQGLRSIFLRPISPYGFARRSRRHAAYDARRWLSFYEEGLDYIIGLNAAGVPMMEHYASIILRKMLTNDDTRLRRSDVTRRYRHWRPRLQLRRRCLCLRRRPYARRDERHDLPPRQSPPRQLRGDRHVSTPSWIRSTSPLRSARRCATTARSSLTAVPTLSTITPSLVTTSAARPNPPTAHGTWASSNSSWTDTTPTPSPATCSEVGRDDDRPSGPRTRCAAGGSPRPTRLDAGGS